MPESTVWPLAISIAALVGTIPVIALAGTRLVAVADELADRTGLGEALFGAVFIGASTSLPGIVTSVSAAAGGHAELSVSNALGGIAAQTAFLAVADLVYRKANLEHAAASAENLMQGALLVTLLAFLLAAIFSPASTLWGIHPATPTLVAAYILGIRLVYRTRTDPMWRPRRTLLTRVDEPGHWASERHGLAGLWLRFAILAPVLAGTGWLIARAGVSISTQTGLTETVIGAFVTAVATSIPELVAAIAAVRRAALALAVGDIVGGNIFDILFVAAADVAYREGSIYHAVPDRVVFLIALTILLSGISLMGFIHREERGIAGIGFESFMILVVFILGYALLFLG